MISLPTNSVKYDSVPVKFSEHNSAKGQRMGNTGAARRMSGVAILGGSISPPPCPLSAACACVPALRLLPAATYGRHPDRLGSGRSP